MVNRCASAASLIPALGSPERGAVAALWAVTEGLVRRRCGRTSVMRKPRPGGRGSPPLRHVGRWVREIQRRPSTSVEAGGGVGWRVAPTLSIDRRRRTGDGAPYDV